MVHLLQQNGQYVVSQKSSALPMISTKKLVEQLNCCRQTDETTWISAFRQWVRDGMN